MRRTFGILMLSFWLFQCSLPLILYEMGIHALKVEKRLRSRKNGKELYAFTFSKEEQIDWVKPGKEFRRKGKLYDVESRKDSAGFIMFIVHADTKEDRIIAGLHQSAGKNASSSGALLKKWGDFKLLYEHQFTDSKEIIFHKPDWIQLNVSMPDKVYNDINVPPPEIA